jgi:hypothetical protein
MTTPSIPDLIAALEEHDAAMTSGPWRSGSYAADVLYDGDREDLPDEVMSCPDINRVRAGTEQNHRDAAAIAWFGTHRGALVEALREVERLRGLLGEARPMLQLVVEARLSVDAIDLRDRIDAARNGGAK